MLELFRFLPRVNQEYDEKRGFLIIHSIPPMDATFFINSLYSFFPLQLLVSTIDFRYITDAITPHEAITILKQNQSVKEARVNELLETGYPCYTTQIGWMGYSDDRIRQLCQEYLAQGFDAFKLKVGRDLKSDQKRCKIVRDEIGWNNKLVKCSFFI